MPAFQVNTGPPRAGLSFARGGRLTAGGPEPPCLVGRPPPLPACLDGPRCPGARLCRPCLGVDRARVPGARLARAGPLVGADPRPCLAYSLARCLPAAVHAPPVPGARLARAGPLVRADPRRADNFNAAYRKPHKNRTFPGFVEN